MTTARLISAIVIRNAMAEDIENIVTMAEHFLADTVYYRRTATTKDSLRASARTLIEQGVVLLAISEDGIPQGMLAGLVYDHYLTNTRMASESVWWVEPEARGGGVAQALLRAFEVWAADHGATAVEIGSWHPRLDRFYERLGYAPAERIFRKAVNRAP